MRLLLADGAVANGLVLLIWSIAQLCFCAWAPCVAAALALYFAAPMNTATGDPLLTAATCTEWDVSPNLPGVNRITDRIVMGRDGNKTFTGDHDANFTEFDQGAG
jgi:hypothetical protein